VQIDEIIKDINEKTEVCTSLAGQVENAMQNVSDVLKNVGNILEMNNENVTRVSTAADSISENTATLMSHKDTILDEVENLSGISEQNAASSQEIAASIEMLSHGLDNVTAESGGLVEIAKKLSESVSTFKI
jgi:methyl-accepting chemotaxis protein